MNSIGELQAAARNHIKPHVPSVSLRKRRYNTDDIINLVQEVLETDHDDTEQFASMLPPNMEGLRMLFKFVDSTFRYVEDPSFNQWIQTPSFLMYTRRGDCKSFTVFISSVLRNMGIPHKIRYVSYGGRKYTHVYPVALLGGQEIPLDVVWKKQEGGRFGAEKQYTKKKDFKVEGLYKLGNTRVTANEYIGKVVTTLEELKASMADIPDSIITAGPGDITAMPQGQVERWLWEERFNIWARTEENPSKANEYRSAAQAMRIGSVSSSIGRINDDALTRQVEEILRTTAKNQNYIFSTIELQIPKPIQVSGFFDDIGRFFQNVADWFKDLFKKFINWVYKDAGKRAGHYYLFRFISRPGSIRTPEIRRRIIAQNASFLHFLNTTKMPKEHLEALNINGIKEASGKTPAELFQLAGTAHIAGIMGPGDGKTVIPSLSPGEEGVPIDQWEPSLQKEQSAIMDAVLWIVDLFKKLFDLFKKGKDKKANPNDRSDIALLIKEGQAYQQYLQNTSGQGSGPDTGTDGAGNESNGAGGGLMLGLLVAMGIVLVK